MLLLIFMLFGVEQTYSNSVALIHMFHILLKIMFN